MAAQGMGLVAVEGVAHGRPPVHQRLVVVVGCGTRRARGLAGGGVAVAGEQAQRGGQQGLFILAWGPAGRSVRARAAWQVGPRSEASARGSACGDIVVGRKDAGLSLTACGTRPAGRRRQGEIMPYRGQSAACAGSPLCATPIFG
jgi:hypothetical protein